MNIDREEAKDVVSKEEEEQLRLEFEKLGVSTTKFRDEPDCPPVDAEFLEELANGELESSQRRLAYQFLIRFKPWRTAYCNLLAENFLKNEKKKTDPNSSETEKTVQD